MGRSVYSWNICFIWWHHQCEQLLQRDRAAEKDFCCVTVSLSVFPLLKSWRYPVPGSIYLPPGWNEHSTKYHTSTNTAVSGISVYTTHTVNYQVWRYVVNLRSHIASDAVEVDVRGVTRDNLGASEAWSQNVVHPGWMQTTEKERYGINSSFRMLWSACTCVRGWASSMGGLNMLRHSNARF